MTISCVLRVAFFLAVTSSVTWAQCVPGDNCEAPDCRCMQDPNAPGGIDPIDIPQMVLVSFGYAINSANKGLHQDLFDGIENPNLCPARGTFFVQKVNSDITSIKELFDEGHEIGMTTDDGTLPTTPEEWTNKIEEVKNLLTDGGIPDQDIQGFRSPQLFVGGDDQFEALKNAGVSYDSSCVSALYSPRAKLLWPFTYDFVDETDVCTIGNDPEGVHAGEWQFLIADLVKNNTLCPTPSSCSVFLEDAQDVYEFFYAAFLDHYDDKRTPFILYLDPMWLTVEHQFEGTRLFLQFIQSGFDDTWIITNRQALQWIQDPVPTANISNFTPWQCS